MKRLPEARSLPWRPRMPLFRGVLRLACLCDARDRAKMRGLRKMAG